MKTFDLISNSFNETVSKAVRKNREDIRTQAPATVISTKDYKKHQCLSIELDIRDIYSMKDATVLQAVKLEKVFVKLPRFGGWKFRFPVAVGDKVTVHWSDKDLSQYLDGTGTTVAQDISEVGELEDCWVELGFGTRKNHNNPDLLNLEVEGKGTKLTITPEGNVTMITEGNISTTAKGTHYFKSSAMTIDNDVTITGNLTVNKTTTLVGNVAASADMGVSGTVTINGVVVNGHTHTSPETGASTGGMQ
ncbi:hypothetical protein NVP1121O_057 [Vibrio phage 1.121.O._10N.286.46.C4]|nr:hypothetical protein NVP1121O_057 [Vibrio phage 1.121.O._10N.286.46.C4]